MILFVSSIAVRVARPIYQNESNRLSKEAKHLSVLTLKCIEDSVRFFAVFL